MGPHYMSKRVAAAADLGELLTSSAPSTPPDRSEIVGWYTARQTNRAHKLATNPVSFPAEEREFTDLQRSILAAEAHIRCAGLPQGQP